LSSTLAVSFFSLDSFIVCLALGPLSAGRTFRMRLAATFGIWDGVASLVGAELGGAAVSNADAHQVGSMLVALYGLYVLAMARLAARERSEKMMFVLPVALNVDNLFAGIGFSSEEAGTLFYSAVTIASGAAAFAGLNIGASLARPQRVPERRRTLLAGFGLVSAATIVALIP
jgi:putative Mn2+ efflux pump MntP